MATDRVKWSNDNKGFRDIPLNGGSDVFVHQSAILVKKYAPKQMGSRLNINS
jgi:cold shock CspA family protein